jgi:N-acetylglucosamine kinase
MTTADTLYLGLDIGGTKIELAACDASLAVVHRERIATPTADFDAFIAQIAVLVRRAEAQLGRAATAVGLGMPGIVDVVSGCQLSSNVPALNGRQVAPALEAALGRPVHMGNDCQCFALSEAQGGAADGLPSMFGAILGTGAGGGYCVGGRLVAGYNGLAGEWGHWPVPAELLQRHGLPLLDCPCGLRGCLERYVSGKGLAALHRLRDPASQADDAAAVHALAAQGDAAAGETLAIHLDLLAQGLASLVLALDPHAIVLGGGLSKLQRLYDELPAAMARHLFGGAHVPPILPPRFGDAGGARGAALLARQRLSSL